MRPQEIAQGLVVLTRGDVNEQHKQANVREALKKFIGVNFEFVAYEKVSNLPGMQVHNAGALDDGTLKVGTSVCCVFSDGDHSREYVSAVKIEKKKNGNIRLQFYDGYWDGKKLKFDMFEAVRDGERFRRKEGFLQFLISLVTFENILLVTASAMFAGALLQAGEKVNLHNVDTKVRELDPSIAKAFDGLKPVDAVNLFESIQKVAGPTIENKYLTQGGAALLALAFAAPSVKRYGNYVHGHWLGVTRFLHNAAYSNAPQGSVCDNLWANTLDLLRKLGHLIAFGIHIAVIVGPLFALIRIGSSSEVRQCGDVEHAASGKCHDLYNFMLCNKDPVLNAIKTIGVLLLTILSTQMLEKFTDILSDVVLGHNHNPIDELKAWLREQAHAAGTALKRRADLGLASAVVMAGIFSVESAPHLPESGADGSGNLMSRRLLDGDTVLWF